MTWRHADRYVMLEGQPSQRCAPEGADCLCATPEPDPASPCGTTWPAVKVVQCGYPATAHRLGDHSHVPTLCLRCGHGIVEMPR